MVLGNLYKSKMVDEAINKGIEYLLSLIENNRWRGFPTLAGESDVWVTGFVLTHICNLCEQKDVIKEAQNFLLASQYPSGGWSYSQQVPPDADSTAWCLMALQSCKDFNGTVFEKAKEFLWSHFTNGGLSTYRWESGIGDFISAPNSEAIIGWTSSHPDVSIAAILADIKNDKVPEVINYLLNRQTNEGFINSYWWRSGYYTTTLLLRAISMLRHHLPEKNAVMIAELLVRRQLAEGGFGIDLSVSTDPFTTALALESFVHLSYLGYATERTMCANALMLSQHENGSWAGDFILRIPAPYVIDPEQVESWNSSHGGGNSFVEDKNGIFATALACYALDCWRKAETQSYISKKWPLFQLNNKAENGETLSIKPNAFNGLA